MAFLRIPNNVHTGLQQIIALSDEEREELVSVLQAVSPKLSPFSFAKDAANRVELGSPDNVLTMVRTLIALYAGMAESGVGAEEYVEDVCSSVDDEGDLLFPSEVREKLRQNLSPLLSLEETVGITAKANSVFSDHAHVFCDARIVTDIRPIFKQNPAEPPAAAAIVHTLKITYHENEKHKDFFVAMDTNDIRKLKSLLERDEQKAQNLRLILSATKIPNLES